MAEKIFYGIFVHLTLPCLVPRGMMKMSVLKVLQIPFSRVVRWYGIDAVPIASLPTFSHIQTPGNDGNDDDASTNDGGNGDGDFLLACLKEPPSSKTCVLYVHGFPDQSVDHRRGGGSEETTPNNPSYGTFSTRMSKKLAEAYTCFCAFNCSGSPGSTSNTVKFYDKTVSQEVWDVLTVMAYLHQKKGFTGFHVIGLSTGAIIGSILRGVSNEMLCRLDCGKILSISVIAACGATSIERALDFDFDSQQQSDFDEMGYCWKQFWLPKNEPNNPEGAVLQSVGGKNIGETTDESDNNQWVPHLLKLSSHYRDDFLKLPIGKHVSENPNSKNTVDCDSANNAIPLLVIHGKADTNIPFDEGLALYEAAIEPKRFFELPKGNHLLTNSKDLKKAIRAIKEWQELYEEMNIQ